MAFNHSGNNIINQTGTDTSLSGLSSLTSANVEQIGSSGYRTYRITRRLRISGTLTIDPSKECLLVDETANNTVEVLNNGTLNLGVPSRTSSYSYAGATAGPVYGAGMALVIGKDNPACCSNGSLAVRNGGTLGIYGATMRTRSVITLSQNASFISRDGVIICAPPSSVGTNVHRIRVDAGSGVDIQGLTVWGAQFDVLRTVPFTNFEGYAGRDVAVPIEASPNASNSSLRGTLVNVRALPDFRPYSSAAMNNWRGAQDLRITNSEAGSATLCVPDQVRTVTTAGQGSHGGRIYHEATISVADETGTDIEGARVYVRDTDNGLRVAATTTGNVSIDETDDHVYSALTNAQGQVTHTVLTAMWYRRNDVSDIAGPDGNEIVDIRSKTNTQAVDDYDFYVEAYGYQPANFEAILHGTQPYTRTQVLRADEAITEDTKATVDAYTEIENAAQLYDAIRAAKVDDPTLGGLGVLSITRNGTTIDFGGLNVVLSNASKRIAFNNENTTIYLSINTDDFTGNLRATGTITSSLTRLVGFISDTNGATTLLAVTRSGTAPATTYMALYSAAGEKLADNESGGTRQGSMNVALTAAQSEAGMRVINKALGYAPQVIPLDASSGGAISVDFNSHIENKLPDGQDMRITNPLPNTTGIGVAFTLTDLSDVSAVITVPNRQIRVRQAYEAFEQALITDDGLKFLAYGGSQITIDINPTAGDSLYLNYAGTKLDAAAGSANAAVIGTVWHPDGQPIVGDGSNPIISSGVNLDILSDAISRAVLWSDIDTQNVGTQSLAERILQTAAAVTDGTHGNQALASAIGALPDSTLISTLLDNLPDPVSQAQLNTIRDAIITQINALPAPATQAELNAIRDTIVTRIRGTDTDATTTALASAIDSLEADVDGMTQAELLRRLLAIMAGNASVSGNQVTYKRQDGTTDEAAYTVDDDGNRTQV